MMRKVVLFASALILASCGGRSLPTEPVAEPPPVSCDPRLLARVEAEPEVRGTIVQPVTNEERFDTAEFLTGEAEARAWGRRGWDRAAIAKVECERLGETPPRP